MVHRPPALSRVEGSSELRPLPEGWVWTTLGESADLVGGGTPSREKPEYFTGNYVWLTPTEIPKNKIAVVSDSRERITDDALHHSSARLIPKGSILMTSRASIGYVAIAGTEVTTNQGFASFIPREGVNNFYLAYWLWANACFFIEQATGTTFKEIIKSKLRTFSFPLPPLGEQERIVARLEELLNDLEAGAAALERVRAGVKRYKASVLKAACEGRLLVGARRDASLREDGLPEEWRSFRFEELLPNGLSNGLYKPVENLTNDGTRMLDIKGLYKGFDIDFANCRRFTLTENERRKYAIQEGDVLVNRVSKAAEGVGKSALVRRVEELTVFESNMMLARLSNECYPPYINYFLNSLSGRSQTLAKAKTTQQSSVNQDDIKSIVIPLPPLEEQRRIVVEVERRLESARAVESAVEVGLNRAMRLRQAVLRSAFEGRLG
jgi:type I restriction enzyme S subunit